MSIRQMASTESNKTQQCRPSCLDSRLIIKRPPKKSTNQNMPRQLSPGMTTCRLPLFLCFFVDQDENESDNTKEITNGEEKNIKRKSTQSRKGWFKFHRLVSFDCVVRSKVFSDDLFQSLRWNLSLFQACSKPYSKVAAAQMEMQITKSTKTWNKWTNATIACTKSD